MYDAYHDLYTTGMNYTKNMYLTTLKRMLTMPFCEALVMITESGNASHFVDGSLKKSTYEFNIMDEV